MLFFRRYINLYRCCLYVRILYFSTYLSYNSHYLTLELFIYNGHNKRKEWVGILKNTRE